MMTRIKHLYVHVPFCKSICYYCDFCHCIYDESIAKQWLERLKKEIEETCLDQYETIYIGGGTPTALSCEQLDVLLNLVDPYASSVKEYTIEVNPESLDEEKARIFRKHHVNRISMGVQTSDDRLLKNLNRHHTFEDVKKRIAMLRRNGFENISVDLMYSLPDQTMDCLEQSIDDVVSLNVEHISLYSLTIEENTVFGKKGIKNLDEDTEADMYELIVQKLMDRDYIHYEVSNFARDGRISMHNMGYWNYDDFLGVSMGAAGKIGSNRYTNTRDLKRYLNEEDIRDENLYLKTDEMAFENIMMSLRTIYGLDIEEFNRKYDCDLLKKYKKGVENPSILITDGRMICTDLSILNRVLLDFMI
ncbi:MAG: radical SAM family heme chaperone HemW [Erysipelotrichaceae bacterium]|nr:radical SAM family heme chaperone HemW [Erysipelotrichaceae bacterium]MBQ1827266.1 radical SAM family heme chaperone HemW [Erysipelotrichaceae bacterium]